METPNKSKGPNKSVVRAVLAKLHLPGQQLLQDKPLKVHTSEGIKTFSIKSTSWRESVDELILYLSDRSEGPAILIRHTRTKEIILLFQTDQKMTGQPCAVSFGTGAHELSNEDGKIVVS